MGCVLACFRAKDDEQRRTPLLARLVPSKNKSLLPSREQQAEAPTSEGERGQPCDKASSGTGVIDEVNLIEGCGTVLETPAEIGEKSEDVIGQTFDYNDLSSNSHSVPISSSKKLLCHEKHDQLFLSQAKLYGDSSVPENITAGYNITGVRALDCSDNNTLPSVASSKYMDPEGSKYDSGVEADSKSVTLDISPCQNLRQVKPLDPIQSPYTTPLILTDEMQTPFTAYPDNSENQRTRKRTRTRVQHVYPVLNHVENLPQWKLLRENSHRLSQSIDLSIQEIRCSTPDNRENLEKLQQLAPVSPNIESPNGKREGISPDSVEPSLHSRETIPLSPENPQLVDSSIPLWLTPLPAGERAWSHKADTPVQYSHSKRTPDEDKPSVGIATAHWDNVGFSPKVWDGNGIPNTTRKYKEDQKVTWHATPFEERLEKVLSHDKLLPQRKLTEGKPVIFEDEDEGSNLTVY